MILGGSATLLAAGAAAVLADRLTESDLLLPKSVLTGAGTVLLGLLSYLVVLWRRERKRERIRFAKEMGRRICTCSEEGEVFIALPSKSTDTHKVEVCPSCRREISVQTAKV